jgi:hypothetical protein
MIWREIHPYLFSFIGFSIVFFSFQIYGDTIHVKEMGRSEYFKLNGYIVASLVSYFVGVAIVFKGKDRSLKNKLLHFILLFFTAFALNVYLYIFTFYFGVGSLLKYI